MVTQKTIASLLGISQPTVGAVLGKHSNRSKIGVSPELRQRILDKAQELGYRPNLFAQAMTGARTGVIGVIYYHSSLGNTSLQESELSKEIERSGYRALVLRATRGNDREAGAAYVRDLVNQMFDLRVDGVIIAFGTSYVPTSELMRLVKAGIPVVAVSGEVHPGIAHVSVDVEAGIEDLLDHLIKLGYRRILLGDGPYSAPATPLQNHRYSCMRRTAFEQSMKRRGAELVELASLNAPNFTLPAAFKSGNKLVGAIASVKAHAIDLGEFEMGVQLIQEIVRHRIPADALLLRNDNALQGALRAVHELKVCVPDQIGLTGHDGVVWGRYGHLPFTTLEMPYQEIAKKAMELMLAKIHGEGQDDDTGIHRVPGRLIPGATTAPRAGSAMVPQSKKTPGIKKVRDLLPHR